MNEIAPGLLHWSTFHENIGANVDSYFAVAAGVVIDPKVPEAGLDALAAYGRPQQIVLTSGNHTRDSERFAEEFGAPIVVSREGAERIGGAFDVELYTAHEDIAPGVRAHHVGRLSPDEYALHITALEGGAAVALADGLTHYGPDLSFVPDGLIGDDAEGVKNALVARFRTLLELDFEHLLFAHGTPIAGRGKTALRDFVEGSTG